MKITLPGIPPTYNQFIGNHNSPRIYNKKKKNWLAIMGEALGDTYEKIPGEVEISILYVFSDHRRRDLDNYSGKFLMDALVHYGVISDDSYRVVSKLTLQAMVGDEPHTVITITPVGHNKGGGK